MLSIFRCAGFLPEILAGEAHRDAHGKQAVINPGMGGVLRVSQVVQREVGRDDQRLAAAVTAVNHIEHLFQPVFRPAFHAEVVKDQQRITTKAGNVLVAPLKAGGKVIEDKSKVRHADGDFFLHEGVCDTACKVAFAVPTPPQNSSRYCLSAYLPNAPHTGGQARSAGSCRCRSRKSSPAWWGR